MGMKLTSKLLKTVIVEHIRANPGIVKRLWSPTDQQGIDETEILRERVWKRVFKEKEDNTICRTFCPTGSNQSEVSDQVSVHITTDLTDSHILSISIEG